MSKASCVISCPIDTYSGYGARSRDFVKAVIEAKPDWDVQIMSQRWGNTRPRCDDGRGAARRGLLDVRRRQVAPRPYGAVLSGRPLRPVATATGL